MRFTIREITGPDDLKELNRQELWEIIRLVNTEKKKIKRKTFFKYWGGSYYDQLEFYVE